MEFKRGRWRLRFENHKWSLREEDEYFCQEREKGKLKIEVKKHCLKSLVIFFKDLKIGLT